MDHGTEVSEGPCAKPEQPPAAAAGPSRACGWSRAWIATQRWAHSLHMVSPEAVSSAPDTQHLEQNGGANASP